MSPYCLDFHAKWRCRHAGACCRAAWSIPIEGPAFERVRLHFRERRGAPFITGGPLPEGAAALLARRADGACVFYDNPLCAIHHELGSQLLPVACRQFPRIALHDPRGTFISLSHFCPTAARLLLDGGGFDVVGAPAPLCSPAPLEGLDALQAFPPLLNARVLTDLEGYTRWERESLQILASESLSAEHALDRIEAGTRLVVEWRPDCGPLTRAVANAFANLAGPPQIWSAGEDERRFGLACAAVPRGLERPVPQVGVDPENPAALERWPQFAAAARRFVAAHLFGNWIAYHARSLLTIVEALKICLSVLRVEAARSQPADSKADVESRFIEAVRRADLLLVHLVDIPTLVRCIESDENFGSRPLPSLRHHRYSLG